jgi:hypothetical protein
MRKKIGKAPAFIGELSGVSDGRHMGVTVVTHNGCVTVVCNGQILVKVICMPCDDRGRSVMVVTSVRWASHYM